MEAKTYPLQEILKPEWRYIIPTFQRDYEWTLEGQWKLLFEDLEATADRLLEVRGSGDEGSKLKSKEQNISPHFMGAIVCASLAVRDRWSRAPVGHRWAAAAHHDPAHDAGVSWTC